MNGNDAPFQIIPKLSHAAKYQADTGIEGSPDNNRRIMSSLFREFMEALKSEKDFKKFLNHARDQMKQQQQSPVNPKTMRRGYHYDKLG